MSLWQKCWEKSFLKKKEEDEEERRKKKERKHAIFARVFFSHGIFFGLKGSNFIELGLSAGMAEDGGSSEIPGGPSTRPPQPSRPGPPPSRPPGVSKVGADSSQLAVAESSAPLRASPSPEVGGLVFVWWACR